MADVEDVLSSLRDLRNRAYERGRAEAEMQAGVVFAALVAKAGGSVTLSNRDLMVACDLELQCSDEPDGSRTYRVKVGTRQ